MNKYLNNSYEYFNKLADCIKNYKYKEVVFFCVGNSKVWYDCFAPLLADKLREKALKNAFIYGGKQFSITPTNLIEYIDFIKRIHSNACIIVVDNLLTFNSDDCGLIDIFNRSTNISGLYNKCLFGDISILLKTYPYNNIGFLDIQNRIIEQITNIITIVLKIYKKNKNDKI